MAFDSSNFFGNLGGLLGGLFGDTDKPYDEAMKQYQEWANRAQGTQQPYLNAGNKALGEYQDWLNNQKNPSGFINNLMGQYSESPYAHYLQQQAMHAGQNAASASGLSGSSPLYQQLQQNAGNIASQDQNQWLQNVLGINTQYGQGQNNLMQGGQNSANQLTNLYNQMAQRMGEAAYGKAQSKQNNFLDTIGSGLGTIGSFFL